MSVDILLSFNPAILRMDISTRNGDIAADNGLQTAVVVSLLSDAPAQPGDVIPDGGGPRGWWGDAYDDSGNVTQGGKTYRLGSRLWLLKRSVLTQATLNAAQDYALEALQWMLDDGVAGAISVVATATGVNAMNLAVTITQQGAAAVYDVAWSGQANDSGFAGVLAA